MKLVCPLEGAEGEDKGQMGSTRMEEQTLTAELAAVKIKVEDAISKRRKWRGGEGREKREWNNERKREEEFRDKKRKERKFSKKGASRKMSLVIFENSLLPSWFPSIFSRHPHRYEQS